MNKYWKTLDWNGQRLYMPEYTKLFRRIEKIFSEHLLSSGFEECLFPKIFTMNQGIELKRSLPRLTSEWSKELVDSKLEKPAAGYPEQFILSHWQCEPFYYFLQKEKIRTPVKFFDKSGWTYRMENDITDFRLFEFQRIECVWAAPKEEAKTILDSLMGSICHILVGLGLDGRIIERKDEEAETKELSVKDIETEIKEIGKVELVGAHLHGRLFIDGLNIDIPRDYYTGCCGIGLSRIINGLLFGGVSSGENPMV